MSYVTMRYSVNSSRLLIYQLVGKKTRIKCTHDLCWMALHHDFKHNVRLLWWTPNIAGCLIPKPVVPSQHLVYNLSPLCRGGDILLYLSLLSCSSGQFCVCAFSLSIVQAVKHETFTQCGAMAHCLWRWANISPVLGYCVMFDATLNVGQRHRRRANINPAFVFEWT